MRGSRLKRFLKQRWLSPASALLTVAALSLATEHRGPVEDHRKPQDIRRIRRAIAQERKARVVVMGNSLVGHGVHPGLLERHLEAPVYKLWRNSMRSAWWYLALKNVVAQSGAEVVVICFRNTVLTDPTRGVHGEHKEGIGQLATEAEPLLHRLAYYAHLDEFQFLLTRYWSLFQRRDHLKRRTEEKVKKHVARRLIHRDLDEDDVDEAIERVLADRNMAADLISKAQAAHEEPTDPKAYDFHHRVSESFLPHMIDVAKRHGIRLVFARLRTRKDAFRDDARRNGRPGEPEHPRLREYMAHLSDYLARHGSALIDFTDAESIQPHHYREHDHLDSDGREIFTRLLANALKPHLEYD